MQICFTALMLVVVGDLRTEAINQNNAAGVRYDSTAKTVTALVRDTSKALKKYSEVKQLLTDAQLLNAEKAKAKMSSHFVDAVALRSEARVALMKSGKYIEAARFAATEAEANRYLRRAVAEAANSQVLALQAADAAADAAAALRVFTVVIALENRTID